MFEIDVKPTSKHRKVSEEKEFVESLRDSAIEEIRSQITDQLEDVVCPTHGEHVQATVVSEPPDQLKINIEGCCQEAIDLGKKAIS
jgi:hypothetical protein